jgi:hypothetical protein
MASADPVPLGFYATGEFSGGAGLLRGPQGVATDPSGNVYVADTINQRISVFAAAGPFLRAFGHDVVPGGGFGLEVCTTSCKPGTNGDLAGQLAGPNGLGVDAAGNVYVGDSSNHRVSVFTSNGAFLRAFGADVDPNQPGNLFEVCTSTCKSGNPGGAAGSLAGPFGIAVGADGNLYVAEASNHRISAFTPEGGFLRAFGFDVVPGGFIDNEVCTSVTGCKAGIAGDDAGHLDNPLNIAIGGDGNLYIADFDNHRISVFTPAGGFLRAFGYDVDPGGGTGLELCTNSCQAGVPGGAAGQLNGPFGVAVDPAGNVHVGDRLNHRITTFTTGGGFVRSLGFDVDPAGGAGYELCTTSCQPGAPGEGMGQLANPAGVATDARGDLYVAENDGNRVQRFGEPTLNPPPPPASRPSNEFTIGKAKRNAKRGTAELPIDLPGPGAVTLAGKKVKAAAAESAGPGQIRLPVKASGKAKRKLAVRGKLTVSVAVTYTPMGGDPAARSARVKLKKRP